MRARRSRGDDRELAWLLDEDDDYDAAIRGRLPSPPSSRRAGRTDGPASRRPNPGLLALSNGGPTAGAIRAGASGLAFAVASVGARAVTQEMSPATWRAPLLALVLAGLAVGAVAARWGWIAGSAGLAITSLVELIALGAPVLLGICALALVMHRRDAGLTDEGFKESGVGNRHD